MDELDGRQFIHYFAGRSLKSAAQKINVYLFKMELTKLEVSIKPTTVDFAIKSKFWRLACSSVTALGSKKVRISDLHSETCTYTHFWANVINNPAKFAWILRQPFALKEECEFTISRLIYQVTAAMERPLHGQNGRVSASQVRLFLKCLEVFFRIVPIKTETSAHNTISPNRFPVSEPDEAGREKRLAELISKIKASESIG